jgi:hypothetical protein
MGYHADSARKACSAAHGPRLGTALVAKIIQGSTPRSAALQPRLVVPGAQNHAPGDREGSTPARWRCSRDLHSFGVATRPTNDSFNACSAAPMAETLGHGARPALGSTLARWRFDRDWAENLDRATLRGSTPARWLIGRDMSSVSAPQNGAAPHKARSAARPRHGAELGSSPFPLVATPARRQGRDLEV